MVRWAGERVDVYANKIRQLAGLAGFNGAGLERFAKLAFATGYPNAVSIELQQAPNIETLAMGDLLAIARVLTIGNQSHDVAVAMAVNSPRCGIALPSKSGSISNVICHKCNSNGHIAKDCRKRGTRAVRLDTGPGTVRETKQGTRHQHQPSPPWRCECGAPSSEHLCWRGKCSSLINTGCSRTIIDVDRCRSWRSATVNVMIGGMSRPSGGDGMVIVSTEEGSSTKISVLMVRGKPLGFDLLLGIGAIKALGGMVVGPTGSVQLGNKELVKCAAISINEPDFTATFNDRIRAWAVAWK